MPCKSGRDADTTHGELIVQRRVPAARDNGFSRRAARRTKPRAPIGQVGAAPPVGPPALAPTRTDARAHLPAERVFLGRGAAAAGQSPSPASVWLTRTAGGVSTTGSTGERVVNDGPNEKTTMGGTHYYSTTTPPTASPTTATSLIIV